MSDNLTSPALSAVATPSLTTPLPSDLTMHRTPQTHQQQQLVLPAVGALLETTAKSLDDDFANLSGVIGELTDAAHSIFRNHGAKCAAAREQLSTARERHLAAQRRLDDRSAIAALSDKQARIDEQCEQLVVERDRTEKGIAQLRADIETYDLEIEQLTERYHECMKIAEDDLPTKVFIRKLLKSVMPATIHSMSNDQVIKGFIGRKETGDVFPFGFDLTGDRKENVNNIWKLLTQ